jgi:serine/threonine-protein kinase
MPRCLLLVALAVLCFLATGCAREPRVEIASWAALLPGQPPADVRLPAHIHGLPATTTSYALDANVPLPPEMVNKELTLAIHHLPAIASLEVDGEPATLLDPSALDRYRRAESQRWRVPTTPRDRVHLRLTVEHRWAQSGWILAPPELSATLDGGARFVAVDAFNTVAAVGALASASFVVMLSGFLFVSISGRRRVAYGLFALGGATGLSYPAFVLGLTQPVFGVYDAAFVSVMLVVAAVAAIHFSKAYFGLPPPHRAWRWVPLLTLGIALAAHDPFTVTRWIGPIVVLVTVVNTLLQLGLLVRLRGVTARPPNLYLIVLAWPVTAVLGVPDFLAWLGLGDPFFGLRTASVGMTLICLLQATALSREHLSSLARADALNAELAARVASLESKRREVEVLNDELKRQIAARSRELAESFVAGREGLAQPVEALDPGETVQDRYRVVRRIGEGGMGAVYEVERLADRKHFALKMLSVMSDGAARARFAREAQVAATVSHPNVVSIVDFDQAKEGWLFLVMELVEGNTLLEVRRRHRDLPWTSYVLAQVAAGLAALHAKGVVHRDLKPGNVLLSRGADGRRPLVKITDFGISSLVDEEASLALRAAVPSSRPPMPALPAEESATQTAVMAHPPAPTVPAELALPPAPEDTSEMPTIVKEPSSSRRTPQPPLTVTGVVFGTPSYMAAELVAGTKSATRSADVFSLAVIAFELLTGRRPFKESPLQAKMDGRELPIAPSFRDVCPTMDARLAELLDRAIGHDPGARPTAHELALALGAAEITLRP